MDAAEAVGNGTNQGVPLPALGSSNPWIVPNTNLTKNVHSPFGILSAPFGDMDAPFTSINALFANSNPTFGSFNASIANSNPAFGSFNAPIANSNPTFGNFNAPIANSNPTFGNFNAPIANSNPTFGSYNAPIANSNPAFGNFNAPIANSNPTFGNFNAPIANSNPAFGNFNAPIANSNPTFGSFNAPIANSNPTFGSYNAPIANANFLLPNVIFPFPTPTINLATMATLLNLIGKPQPKPVDMGFFTPASNPLLFPGANPAFLSQLCFGRLPPGWIPFPGTGIASPETIISMNAQEALRKAEEARRDFARQQALAREQEEEQARQQKQAVDNNWQEAIQRHRENTERENEEARIREQALNDPAYVAQELRQMGLLHTNSEDEKRLRPVEQFNKCRLFPRQGGELQQQQHQQQQHQQQQHQHQHQHQHQQPQKQQKQESRAIRRSAPYTKPVKSESDTYRLTSPYGRAANVNPVHIPERIVHRLRIDKLKESASVQMMAQLVYGFIDEQSLLNEAVVKMIGIDRSQLLRFLNKRNGEDASKTKGNQEQPCTVFATPPITPPVTTPPLPQSATQPGTTGETDEQKEANAVDRILRWYLFCIAFPKELIEIGYAENDIKMIKFKSDLRTKKPKKTNIDREKQYNYYKLLSSTFVDPEVELVYGTAGDFSNQFQVMQLQ